MVLDDPGEAATVVARGGSVVLVVGTGEPVPYIAGPGRLAVMVGAMSDPRVAAAAAEMDRELFGS